MAQEIFDSMGSEVKFASIAAHTTGAVVAAVTGRRILVIAYVLSLDGAGEFQWLSAATALSGAVEVAADSPTGLTHSAGVLCTAASEALNMTATAAANGHLVYKLI